MSIYDQIHRVREKLPLAKAATNSMKVFGASSHNYQLNEPLSESQIHQFEQLNGITLPEEFRLFLREVGNGGAGPYYGIYKLDPSKTNSYLSKPCRLHPEMTDEGWKDLRGDDEDDDDDDYLEKIFQGMLDIGTQGCTYETMLVVNGPHKGRVVYIDYDLQKPFFTYEENFLDWYERWLDEVIKGHKIVWFGVNKATS